MPSCGEVGGNRCWDKNMTDRRGALRHVVEVRLHQPALQLVLLPSSPARGSCVQLRASAFQWNILYTTPNHTLCTGLDGVLTVWRLCISLVLTLWYGVDPIARGSGSVRPPPIPRSPFPAPRSLILPSPPSRSSNISNIGALAAYFGHHKVKWQGSMRSEYLS